MPKIVDKEQKRNEIIEESVCYYNEVGLRKFNIETLAKRMSIGKGTIYHYFKSKHEIIFLVNEKNMEKHLESIELKINEETNLEKKIFILFDFYLNSSIENQNIRNIYKDYILMRMESNEDPHMSSHSCKNGYRELLEKILRKGIKDKLIPVYSLSMIEGILAAANGMLLFSFMEKDYDLETELQKYITSLLNTINK